MFNLTAAELVPDGQLVQEEAPFLSEKEPAGQEVQEVAPADE